MKSISWFRGSSKKPRTPKELPTTKPKKVGPRNPGTWKPRVRRPFVHGEHCSCCLHKKADVVRANASVAGLNSVAEVADRNGMVINSVKWERGPGGPWGCTYKRSDEDIGAVGVCDELASQSAWGGLEDFKRAMAASYGENASRGNYNGGYGIWMLSHINCTCSVRISMADPKNPTRSATYIVSAEPMQVVDDIAKGITDPSKALLGFRQVPVEGEANLPELDPVYEKSMAQLTKEVSPGDEAAWKAYQDSLYAHDRFYKDIVGGEEEAELARLLEVPEEGLGEELLEEPETELPPSPGAI